MPRLDDPAARGADLAAALDDATRARLDRGELEILALPPKGGNGVAVRALRVVEAAPDKVWPVVRDADRFAEFMPKVTKSHVVSREPLDGGGEAVTTHTEIGLPFPMKNLESDIRSVSRDLPEGGHERRWTLVKGSYKKNDGGWTVLPWPAPGQDPGRTLLVYDLDVAPRINIPEKLLRKAQAGTLPDLFEAVSTRVRELG